MLDFQRIREKVCVKSLMLAQTQNNGCLPQERQAGKTLFLTADGLLTQLATTISTTVSTHHNAPVTTDEPKPVIAPGKAGRLMSKADQQRVREAIAKATSVEEIRRLERSLKEGFLPDMESVGA